MQAQRGAANQGVFIGLDYFRSTAISLVDFFRCFELVFLFVTSQEQLIDKKRIVFMFFFKNNRVLKCCVFVFFFLICMMTVHAKEKEHVLLNNKSSLAAQVIKKDCIYEIRNEFNLEGITVSIPSGSTLFFNGGSFSNGKLNGNHTIIDAGYGKIFGKNMILSGSFVSDMIRMSWWGTYGASDNTKEVQSAFNSILLFENREFVFDMSVRITDVFFVLKYSPGVVFKSFSSSRQGKVYIEVFGNSSQGIDISGTERLSFQDLVIKGDVNNKPRCLLFGARIEGNEQCVRHVFNRVSFCGDATESFVYNVSGEMWTLNDCSLRIDSNSSLKAGIYASTLNSYGLFSKSGKTTISGRCLTITCFENCTFSSMRNCPTVFFEGDKKNTVSSIYFDRCYFYCPTAPSVVFHNVRGDITFFRCVDESGSQDPSQRATPFISFTGTRTVDGISFINNCFYAKRNTAILDCRCPVTKYMASSNVVINSLAEWRFTTLKNGCHRDLSSREKFIVSNNIENVQVESEVRNSGNVKIPKSNQRPELTESDEGFIYYDYNQIGRAHV